MKWPVWLTTQHSGTRAFPGESLGAWVCGVKRWVSARPFLLQRAKKTCAQGSRIIKIVFTVWSWTVLNELTFFPLAWVYGRDLMTTINSLPSLPWLCWPHQHRGKGKECLGILWKSFDFVDILKGSWRLTGVHGPHFKYRWVEGKFQITFLYKISQATSWARMNLVHRWTDFCHWGAWGFWSCLLPPFFFLQPVVRGRLQ